MQWLSPFVGCVVFASHIHQCALVEKQVTVLKRSFGVFLDRDSLIGGVDAGVESRVASPALPFSVTSIPNESRPRVCAWSILEPWRG